MKTSTATLILLVAVCFVMMADQANGGTMKDLRRFYVRSLIEEILYSIELTELVDANQMPSMSGFD
ncbi:hypothetical protein TrispH2_011557 [Trichoplax sp. H2]|nr:hypothetical protein TrispH2_011557 [Trichoplax sp. H2]|eukprot:RDD36641.1 hypothetical protein TrispH2_011557 [Trichoplax sp. H2]